MIDFNKLGVAARAKRGNRSLRDVEKESGLDKQTLANVERGKSVGLETVLTTCRWIGLPVEYFYPEPETAAA